MPESPIAGINNLLHDCRSAYLRTMPRVKGAMLSAGCAGKWYFDWIEDRTKHGHRHIGVEFYSPKPPDLPTNVEWIANTVGVMRGVQSEECELVFSGQNLEHLWPEEVVGFLLESWRVLKPDGWLVIDSPNRNVTEVLNWSHPEHTVELTPSEIQHLVQLAGFDVASIRGIWVCRDGETGRVLNLDPNINDEKFPTIERCVSAIADPENSLLWWIEARKSLRPPQSERLTGEMNRIFEKAWPERMSRFVSHIGKRNSDGTGVSTSQGEAGAAVFGPYMPLRAGLYSAFFEVTHLSAAPDHEVVARIDVVGDGGRDIAVRELSIKDLRTSEKYRIDFDLPKLEFGIQTRCFSSGKADLNFKFPEIKTQAGDPPK